MRTALMGELEVSRIGLGAMGMSAYYTGAGRSDEEASRTIQHAIDVGVTHLDTAEVYGPFVNEQLVGRAATAVDLHLIVDPSVGSVGIRLNNVEYGSFAYQLFQSSDPSQSVSLNSSGSAEFDYVRVREAQP